MRKVYTSRFGEIEVDEKKIVHLPYDEESPYYFMQSIKSPDLAFLLTIPFLFFPDYTFEIDEMTVEELGIKNPDAVFYYSMITIPNGSIRYMTANLVAPVVLNSENMQAKQIVLEKSNYTTKHRLFPESAKKEG